MKLFGRMSVMVLAGTLGQAGVAQVPPEQWAACIAAPEVNCIFDLAVAELVADGAMTGRDGRLRQMAELLVREGDAAGASNVVRAISVPADALRLWPSVLALRPDPADLEHALALARLTENPISRQRELNGIARALVQAGDLAAARAVIDGTPDNLLASARTELAVALARQGDLAGARALDLTRDGESWAADAQAAVFIARAEAGDLVGVQAELDQLPADLRADVALGLVPLVLSSAQVDSLLPVEWQFGRPAEYTDFRAEAIGTALAAAPADFAVAEALRLAESGIAPEHAAAILIAVLRATGDGRVATAALAAADRIADFRVQASVRLDAAPWTTPEQLAVLVEQAKAMSAADEAFMLANLAAASGNGEIALQALPLLPRVGDERDIEEAFTAMAAAVAAGPSAAAVADLFEGVNLDRPAWDDAVMAVAEPLAKAELDELALRLARAMTYPERQAQALGDIAASTADTALLAEALALTQAVGSNFYRTDALLAITAALLDQPD